MVAVGGRGLGEEGDCLHVAAREMTRGRPASAVTALGGAGGACATLAGS